MSICSLSRGFLLVTCCLASLGQCAENPGKVNASLQRAEDIKGLNQQASSILALKKYLQLEANARPPLAANGFSKVPLSRQQAEQARQMLWQDHLQQLRTTRAEEMKARKISLGDLEMPFYYKVFGEMPKEGRSLYISLHGGGGAPKRVNDQQWENQKRLYRPQEGVYLVPRAPTDTWNLWHQGHIDKMFGRLIENMIAFENVDPDRVYLHGYSAGGDGVYQLAPRMADRWAAAAMMAGHPNETSPLGLRNIAFTIHVGGRDAAYNRNKIAAQWEQKLADLQKADPDGYRHLVKIYPDKGHWMDRRDAVALPWMARHRRNTLPKRIVWKQDDVAHSRFYWLAVDSKDYRGRAEVVANLDRQNIDVKVQDVDRLTIRLNDQMLNLDQPIVVASQGKQLFRGKVERTIRTIAKTLYDRGDPKSVFSGEVTVPLP